MVRLAECDGGVVVATERWRGPAAAAAAVDRFSPAAAAADISSGATNTQHSSDWTQRLWAELISPVSDSWPRTATKCCG